MNKFTDEDFILSYIFKKPSEGPMDDNHHCLETNTKGDCAPEYNEEKNAVMQKFLYFKINSLDYFIFYILKYNVIYNRGMPMVSYG